MSLPLIKFLLLGAIAAFAVLAFRGSKRASYRAVWRFYGAALVVAAVLAVLFPDALTRLAEVLGVGRGADLLLYVLVVTFMLVSVVLFRRVAELERRYVQLVRSLAVERAETPAPGPGNDGST